MIAPSEGFVIFGLVLLLFSPRKFIDVVKRLSRRIERIKPVVNWISDFTEQDVSVRKEGECR